MVEPGYCCDLDHGLIIELLWGDVGYFLHLDIIQYINHGHLVSMYVGKFLYLPVTEAGVEGRPEELCILTPETKH